MDAIQLIKKDHREVEKLFQSFERARRAGDGARQAAVVRQIIRDLSVHAVVEEEFLYPALREAGVGDDVLEALEEHHVMKVALAELEGMGGGDRFAAKVQVLAENVREHIREEERELLPKLRQALQPSQLRELGDSLAKAKRTAPTRPHPTAPDTPPANFVVGAFAALYDRSRDALRGAALVAAEIAARGARRWASAARDAASRAQERSREAVDGVTARGRDVLAEARERGSDAMTQTRKLGREAAADARETADELRGRGRRAAKRTERRGRAAANQARKTGQRAAKKARGQARAATRGFEGEPRPVVH
jgi:hypothetical protein